MRPSLRQAALLTVAIGCGSDSESPGLLLGDAVAARDVGTSVSDTAVVDAAPGAEADVVTKGDATAADGALTETGPDVAVAEDAAVPDDALLPPYDAGDPFGDAGPLGTPAWAAVEVHVDGTHCAPLTACGGDVLGTWDVAGGCFEYPPPAELSKCPGATLTAVGQARGRVTFNGVIAARQAQSEVTTTLFVPAICATFVGGCGAIEMVVAASFPGAKCAANAKKDCECAARFTFDIDDGDLYAIEDDAIVSTSSGKRWEYCVSGQSLRYRDVSPSGSLEPGIIQLERQ